MTYCIYLEKSRVITAPRRRGRRFKERCPP